MAKVQCPDCGFEQELPFRDSDNPDEKDVECARCGYVLFGPSLSHPERGRDKRVPPWIEHAPTGYYRR